MFLFYDFYMLQVLQIVPPPPQKKKKKKKKNDNWTFSINNFRNCELTWICFRIINPIWFSSNEEMLISVRYVISPIQVLYIHLHKPFKRSVEFSFHCVAWVSFLSKFGWKGLMTCLIKSLFLPDYWTKSDVFFAEMQIISYKFIILKHIQINLQFQKILMLKVRLYFFLGQSSLGVKNILHFWSRMSFQYINIWFWTYTTAEKCTLLLV